MSGRFFLTTNAEVISDLFDLRPSRSASGRSLPAPIVRLTPRHNIAPESDIAIVRAADGVRTLSHMRWGMAASWARATDVGVREVSCAIETIDSRPSIRAAFASRRCLIPADGFFEWLNADGVRRPLAFRVRAGTSARPTPFAMAGIWDTWESPNQSPLETCAIVTVPANELVGCAHRRMPAIVRPEDYGVWLGDGSESSPQQLERVRATCRTWPASMMFAYEVGELVNSPRCEDPRCIQPAEAGDLDLNRALG